ncbi:MAG: prepilin-type N-terminal cleavage/methylation domain-containing protein [Planctomycetes bacterium]|nr:prepilin-type N-terminal cleavage/methylation domain-containing protein [Planctomycetota bacterium]MBI3844455.1 prepilin-type N-terminal cleavage/methylation domain-containing protein [Planctomycetota bacterium]
MKTSQAGFTLLEVLLAVAIFAFGLLATTLIGSNATDEADLTEKLMKADFLVREKMSDVLLGQNEYGDGDGGSYEDHALAGFRWRVQIEDIPFLGVSPEDVEDAKNGSKAGTGSSDRKGSSSVSSRRGRGSSAVRDAKTTDKPTNASTKPNKKKAGKKGDLFGGGDDSSAGGDLFGGGEADEEWLQKIVVEVMFPYYKGEQAVRAVTYVPREEDEEAQSGDDSTTGNANAKNKKNAGAKAGKNSSRTPSNGAQKGGRQNGK